MCTPLDSSCLGNCWLIVPVYFVGRGVVEKEYTCDKSIVKKVKCNNETSYHDYAITHFRTSSSLDVDTAIYVVRLALLGRVLDGIWIPTGPSHIGSIVGSLYILYTAAWAIMYSVGVLGWSISGGVLVSKIISSGPITFGHWIVEYSCE